MLAPTHSVFGIFLTLIVLALFGVKYSLHWSIILFAIIGAVLPDIDHPKSMVGRMFPFLSVPIERRYGHRTITHSLIAWLVSTLVFACLVLFVVWILGFVSDFGFRISDFAPRWIIAFSISYLSHLLLDMFNKRGSQMFWPDPGRDVIPKNQKFRLESGAKAEVLIFVILLVLVFLALPLSKYGVGTSLRWLLGTPGSAIEEFKTLKHHAYLDFEGVFRDTKEPIKGKAEILDAEKDKLVILYKKPVRRSPPWTNEGGSIYTISDELQADIIASKTRVQKTDIPIKTEKKIFQNETREQLLSQIPKGSLISGIVHLPNEMKIKGLPAEARRSLGEVGAKAGMYKVLEQSGDDLILRYATKQQIEKLELTESFELQQRKDQAELTRLKNELYSIKSKINKIRKTDQLTPLGKELLIGANEIEKQQQEIEELSNRQEEVDIKIQEVILKMKSRRFVFSGEVYIRM